MAGLFISFEGIDQSGKSTQAERLVAHLKGRGHSVVFTREPGATELGAQIRHLVLRGLPRGPINSTAEMFLFAADRAQHVAEVIRPALACDKIVISDRYVDSTLAYQGYGRGLELPKLEAIQDMATGGLLPDLTVWVDVDLATSRARGKPGEADRMESENDVMFERVRAGYEKLCSASPNRFLRVDGTRAVPAIFEDILRGVEPHLEEHTKVKNVQAT